MPNQTVKNGLKAKGWKDQIDPNEFFSRKATNKIFLYLLPPFIWQNFKRILGADPELSGCTIFGPKMTQLSWINFFGEKTLLLLSSTYWPFSLCKFFLKKSYHGTRVMRMHHFWALNGPFTPNNIFFGKLLKSISSNY